MSLKTFINKIWDGICSIFDNMPAEIKTAVHIGVIVTENIKTFVNSPAADVLTAIIPGNIDDEIKDLLRAKLPAILTELKLADNCASLTDESQIISCAINTLQGLDTDIKSAFLHSLSIFIAQAISNSKLTWSDGVTILEWYYQNKYKATS